jgi:hypothetical protein
VSRIFVCVFLDPVLRNADPGCLFRIVIFLSRIQDQKDSGSYPDPH